MILRFAYNRERSIEIGRRLLEELEQLPTPKGFGGFGFSISPPSGRADTFGEGSIYIDFDPPREYRHPDELADVYGLVGGDVHPKITEWFESWRKFDEAAQEISNRYNEENPGFFISAGGASFGPQVERIKGCRDSDIPDFLEHDEMAGMGGGEFTPPGTQDWRGGDPALEEE